MSTSATRRCSGWGWCRCRRGGSSSRRAGRPGAGSPSRYVAAPSLIIPDTSRGSPSRRPARRVRDPVREAHLNRLGGIRVSALFTRGCEGGKQLRLADRFDEMYVKACVSCALAILLLPPSGLRDERDALAPRTRAYSPRG